MKVTASLNGGGFSQVEHLVNAARQRALVRLESHLVARNERARALRMMRETRRETIQDRS